MGGSAQGRTSGGGVAVLTRRGGVVWSPVPRRVTMSRPCVIDPSGVRLYRWPMRSVFVPLERVDRFDVVLEQTGADGDGTGERLVLVTRDGKIIRVETVAIRWLSGWHRLPLQAHAQHLNNHILPTWRAGGRAAPTDRDET